MEVQPYITSDLTPMTFKLSEIFVALPEQSTYSALSFYQMEVRADFIDRLAIHFHLLYLDEPLLDEQLCYASSENVRLEYKYFITKAELLKMVLPQISGKDIALTKTEVTLLPNR